MANGDLIKQVRDQLGDPKGITAKAAQILTLSLLADLYDKWVETDKKVSELYPGKDDHEKVEKMWPAFKIGIAVAGVIMAANVTLLVGILTHTFHFSP